MRSVYGIDGNVAATIDSSGHVMVGPDPGPIVGVILSDSEVYSGEAGDELLGRIDSDSNIVDAQYQLVASVDVNGRVRDTLGRPLGQVEQPVDGAVLVLLVGRIAPETISLPVPPSDAGATVMDEVLELADASSRPGIKKNYKPLTDADVLGSPLGPGSKPKKKQ